MAHAIGTRMIDAKQSITVYDRSAEKAHELASTLGTDVQSASLTEKISGDIVIFALPYTAALEVAQAHAQELAGKTVVDISNPVNFQTFELLTPKESSAAEEIAKLLPKDAHMIKAFNSTFAQALIDGTTNGTKTEVKIAGDNAQAKVELTNIIEESGLEVADVGPLAKARDLEKTAQENIRKMFAK